MATLDDAFRRLALDNSNAGPDALSDEPDDDDDSVDEDEDDDDEDGDGGHRYKRPSKRPKTSHSQNEVDSVRLFLSQLSSYYSVNNTRANCVWSCISQFMVWSITESISSRHVLLLHMQYDVYDTVNPAIFYPGARVNLDSEGVLSPPVSPASSFPIKERMLLFLTSELGEDKSGILHDGIFEVEWDEKNSSTLKVMVKLAFTDEHQTNLVHEWSVHMHLLSESVAGIPSILGVFHDEEEDGPSCFFYHPTGVSLANSKQSLTSDQKYVVPIRNSFVKSSIFAIGHRS